MQRDTALRNMRCLKDPPRYVSYMEMRDRKLNQKDDLFILFCYLYCSIDGLFDFELAHWLNAENSLLVEYG